MTSFEESPVNNTASMGHGGNLFPGPEATPDVSQSLNDLMSGSNHANALPLISSLTQIFSTSQAPPFSGFESMGLLNLIQTERSSLFASLLNLRSFISIPGLTKGSGKQR
jgi:hypothetical protein